MNQINAEKWSSEWYELATTDELTDLIKEAKDLLRSRVMTRERRLIWEERIKRITDELNQRKTSGDEYEER